MMVGPGGKELGRDWTLRPDAAAGDGEGLVCAAATGFGLTNSAALALAEDILEGKLGEGVVLVKEGEEGPCEK